MKIHQSLVPIIQFANSVREQWGTLVTSGALIGCLGIWQATGHSLNPSVYWIIAIGGLLIAFYLAWNEQRIEKERLIAANEKSSRATTVEWKELAERFKA